MEERPEEIKASRSVNVWEEAEGTASAKALGPESVWA